MYLPVAPRCPVLTRSSAGGTWCERRESRLTRRSGIVTCSQPFRELVASTGSSFLPGDFRIDSAFHGLTGDGASVMDHIRAELQRPPSRTRRKQIHVWLNDREYAALRALARSGDETMSAIVRRILKEAMTSDVEPKWESSRMAAVR